MHGKTWKTPVLFSSIFILTFAFSLPAQVVNTEKLRLNTGKTNNWVGDASLSFGLARNKAGQTLTLGADGRLEFLQDRSRWMVLGGYGLTQFLDVYEANAVPSNFRNTLFGHLRFNHQFTDWLTWEAFSQAQHDEIQEVDVRLLNGTGPRFQLAKTDSSHLYFGLLYMYEYEETSEFEDRIIYNKDNRLSSYLSAGIQIKKYFLIDHVTYYQPNLANFSDFRISSETNIRISVAENVAFTTYFQLIYDAQPPETVPNTMYTLRNGLSLTF